MIYASQKFPIGVQPSNYPKDVAAAVHYDPNALTTEKIKEKVGADYIVPRSIVRPDIAKELSVYKDRTPTRFNLDYNRIWSQIAHQ